jgi:hypothetical protein
MAFDVLYYNGHDYNGHDLTARTRCEEGDELLRISADYIADIEQDEEPEISFQVVLSIPIASDRPWYVVPVLNRIYHSISHDLFPDFTRFF